MEAISEIGKEEKEIETEEFGSENKTPRGEKNEKVQFAPSQRSSSREPSVEVTGGTDAPSKKRPASSRRINTRSVTGATPAAKRPKVEKKGSKTPKTEAKEKKKSKDVELMEETEEDDDVGEIDLLPVVYFTEDFEGVFGFKDLMEVLDFQGWTKLFQKNELVSPSVLRTTLSKTRFDTSGKIFYVDFVVDDVVYKTSSTEIAKILNVPHDGFDEYYLKGWPAAVDHRILQMAISGTEKISGTLYNTHMDPVSKVLHHYIVRNLLPRRNKKSVLQTMDILMVDMLARFKKINLPKIMIHHMKHMTKDGTVMKKIPYPGLLKKIMQARAIYGEPKDEIDCSQPIGPTWLTKLKEVLLHEQKQKEKEKGKSEASMSSSHDPLFVVDALMKISDDMAEIKQLLMRLVEKIAPAQD